MLPMRNPTSSNCEARSSGRAKEKGHRHSGASASSSGFDPNRSSLKTSQSRWNSGVRIISGVRGRWQVDGNGCDDPPGPRRHHGHLVGEKTASEIECVTRTVVVGSLHPDPLQAEIEPLAHHVVEGAEWFVEQKRLGLVDERPATATRCRMPPESWAGRAFSKPCSPTRAINSRMDVARPAALLISMGKRILSSTDRQAAMTSWKAMPIS